MSRNPTGRNALDSLIKHSHYSLGKEAMSKKLPNIFSIMDLPIVEPARLLPGNIRLTNSFIYAITVSYNHTLWYELQRDTT